MGAAPIGGVDAGAIGGAPLGGFAGHPAVVPVCGGSVGHGSDCASQRHATSVDAQQMTAASDLDMFFRIPRFPLLPAQHKRLRIRRQGGEIRRLAGC